MLYLEYRMSAHLGPGLKPPVRCRETGESKGQKANTKAPKPITDSQAVVVRRPGQQ